MAETMRDIKRRMKTVQSTEHITNAMRLVSAAKFRRAKGRYDQACRQLAEITGLMENLLGECSAPQPTKGALLILITSNRGLCGGYNTGLIKLAADTVRNLNAGSPDPSESVSLYTIGSRGQDFFQRQNDLLHQNCSIIGTLTDAPEAITPKQAEAIAGTILREWQEGRAGEILLVGMRYVNTLKQEPEVRKILPVRGRTPDGAGGLESAGKVGVKWESDLEMVPSREEILEWMLPKYLELVLYQACLESAACEHAARRTAMESATDNANEMLAHLSMNYNRARQQAITDELIEIVSGSEALR